MKVSSHFYKVFVLIFIVGLMAVTLPRKVAHGQSISLSFAPEADATVNQADPNRNYGRLTSLSVDGSPVVRSYLRFNVSGLNGATVTNTKLKLYTINASTDGFSVAKANSNSWNENKITYNKAPGFGSALGSIGAYAAGQFIEIDITGAVTGEGRITLVLTTDYDSTISVSSREAGASGPTLVLTLNSTQASATPTNVLLPTVTNTPVPTNPPAPSATPTQNAQPTSPPSTPTQAVTPVPTTNPGIPTTGIWISPQEIKALPIAGQSGCASGSLCAQAWNGLVSRANSTWGAPNLSYYAGQDHSQAIFAGALVAVRCENVSCPNVNAPSLRTKVLEGLDAVIGTEQAALPPGVVGEHLAPFRQFPRYVLAAELMGITDWGSQLTFYTSQDCDPSSAVRQCRNYVDYMAHTRFATASDTHTFAESHDSFASNGNTMGGFARIVASAYLNDTADLDKAWLTFRRYAGDTSVGPNLGINTEGRPWFYANYSTDQHLGINPTGATCYQTTYPADGVIPADQGRGGSCPADINTAPGYTQYPWEGLQGIFSQAEVLKRLGYQDPSGNDPYHIQNNALLRAVQYQWYLQSKFGGTWYDSSRAAWVKHLAYHYYGYKPLAYNSTDGGRNIGYTAWTHP